jgi:cold shock CspA family protein/ribosome-associated translation inhibitor RaiA
MAGDIQVTFHGLAHSETIERRIREKAAQLTRAHSDIISWRATVDAPHQHHHRGQLYSVRLDIRVPAAEIVVNRGHHRDHAHEDVYVAIRDAFDAADRRLGEHAQQRRGEVKSHGAPAHGRITKLFRDDGYGFAQLPDGVDVYFHENSVTSGALAELRVGDEVRIVIAEGEGERGPQASTVTPIGKHHPGPAVER